MPRTPRLLALLAVLSLGACAGSTASPATSSVAPNGSPSDAGPTASASAPALPAASSASASPGIGPPSAAAAGEPRTIELPGDGPLGMDIADGEAYVSTHDSSQLVVVDLATGEATIQTIGPNVIRVIALDGERLALGRYATAAGHSAVELLDLASGGTTQTQATDIDAINPAEDGRIWAFEKAGSIALLDGTNGGLLGRAPIEAPSDEHLEVIGAAGSAFASASSTPVTRLGGDPLRTETTIDTGGGFSLAVDGGLVWGARETGIWAIDPTTNTVVKRVPLDDVSEILGMDVEGDDAWLAIRHPGRIGAVIRVDLATGAQTEDHPASLPAAIEIDGDTVWVTDYETDSLLGFSR